MYPKDVFKLSPNSTLEAQVLTRLREAILDGTFEPGSQLNHVRLAEQFGVSRGPIRAALGKLEEEGLVHHVPHRGTFVTALKRKSVEDLYNLRAVIEQYATELAVQNSTLEDLDYLETLLEDLQLATNKKDANKIVSSDFSIHKFIIKLSGNYFIQQTWSNLQLHVRWTLADRYRNFDNLQEIAEFHCTLIENFRKKNTEGAGLLMHKHILDALNELVAKWEKSY